MSLTESSIKSKTADLVVLSVLLASCRGPQIGKLDAVVRNDRRVGAQETPHVQIVRGGAPIKTELNMSLLKQDEIQTDADTTALIAFAGGTQLIMGPRTRIKIQNPSIWSFFGEIFVKVKGFFQVETEYIAAGPHGTEFLFTVNEEGEASVLVADGVVEVQSKKQAWTPRFLGRFDRATIRGNAAPSTSRVDAETFESFIEWIKKAERLLQVDAEPFVPNVVGQSEANGRRILRDAGLLVGHVRTEARGSGPSGTIVEQNPGAGIRRSRGSPVALVIEAEPPRQISVPKVVGLGIEEAKAALVREGLQVGGITSRASDRLPQGTVVDQRPGPGEILKEHGVVQLVLAVRKVQENLEIVFDRSAAMGRAFGGETTLDAAVRAVAEALRPQTVESDNLALRLFGGTCESGANQLVVPFGQNNSARVRRSLRSPGIDGRSTLVAALLNAIDDFSDTERFSDVSTRVLVITGSSGDCLSRGPEIIRERLRHAKIRPDFHFVGINLSRQEQIKLQQIAGATEGKVSFMTSPQQVEERVAWILEVAPVVSSVQRLVDVVNTVLSLLDEVIGHLNRDDYPSSEKSLQDARNEFDRSRLPFQDLEKRTTREKFREAYGNAKELRGIQQRLLTLCAQLISGKRDGDREGFDASVKELNELRERYKTIAEETNGILRELLSEE